MIDLMQEMLRELHRDDIREMAIKLSQEIATRADHADLVGRLPTEDVKALVDSGFLLLSIPRHHGGFGLSLRSCVAAMCILAHGSASTALVAAMQLQVFGHAGEARAWPERIFAQFCRAATQGGLFNFLASEPTLGSPSRGGRFQTTLATDTNDWVLNGHKTWCTGGEHLTHLLVRVDVDGDAGVVYVPNHVPGVQWQRTWGRGLSLRASDSDDVVFKEIHLPADHLIERAGEEGSAQPNGWFPMMMAATYLGTAFAARDTTIRYTLNRVPTALGRPIATLPKIQRQIGEMDLHLQAATALMLDAASAWAQPEVNRTRAYARVAAAKQLVTQTAAHVTALALQVAGGNSITKELPLERYFRDVQAGHMQPPSGDTALELIGRSAIAIHPSYAHYL